MRTLTITMLFLTGIVPIKAAIFSDFGPGSSYSSSGGWAVGLGFAQANMFTATTSGIVNQIDVAMTNAGGPGTATVSLWTDVGDLPGVELGSWDVTASQPCCAGEIVTIPVGSGPSLNSGQSYFLEISPTDASTFNIWLNNDQGISGLDLFSLDGGISWNSTGNQTIGAFDILGSPSAVPEPATFVLLGCAVICMSSRWRKRKPEGPVI